MRYTKIAEARPFEGKPSINLASVFGASPKKEIILRIPVSGQRPITYSVEGLPAGLALKGGIITGAVANEGDYEITIIAENALGRAEKKVTLEIYPEHVLIAPLLGFTSWNAFGPDVTQSDIETIAERMVELGITEYGYSYVNLDSGWQHSYGGKYDAIMPSAKFPDMKAMTDKVHSLGLKCGIYSTPMLTAWGCPDELPSIPGCTVGEPDYRFPAPNGGIGVIRKEKNNALQWQEWGFDYLKYDWQPTDPVNADLMRCELMKLDRDFGFCVTVHAMKEYDGYLSRFCNSFRDNIDSYGHWQNLLMIYYSYFKRYDSGKRGHYFDLDMLDIGTCKMKQVRRELSEDEQIMAFTMRAFFNSPIQISSALENVSAFELSLYCNEEMIALNQDAAFANAVPIFAYEQDERKIHVFEKPLYNGDFAYAIFNIGESDAKISLDFGSESSIRDVWAKENLTSVSVWTHASVKHSVRVVRCSSKADKISAESI